MIRVFVSVGLFVGLCLCVCVCVSQRVGQTAMSRCDAVQSTPLCFHFPPSTADKERERESHIHTGTPTHPHSHHAVRPSTTLHYAHTPFGSPACTQPKHLFTTAASQAPSTAAFIPPQNQAPHSPTPPRASLPSPWKETSHPTPASFSARHSGAQHSQQQLTPKGQRLRTPPRISRHRPAPRTKSDSHGPGRRTGRGYHWPGQV